jgi:hypothetical protein
MFVIDTVLLAMRRGYRGISGPLAGLEIRQRRWKQMDYQKCFVGGDAVTWLVEWCKHTKVRMPSPEVHQGHQQIGYRDVNRGDAASFMQHLFEMKILHHVNDSVDCFKDDYIFYRLYEDEPPHLRPTPPPPTKRKLPLGSALSPSTRTTSSSEIKKETKDSSSSGMRTVSVPRATPTPPPTTTTTAPAAVSTGGVRPATSRQNGEFFSPDDSPLLGAHGRFGSLPLPLTQAQINAMDPNHTYNLTDSLHITNSSFRGTLQQGGRPSSVSQSGSSMSANTGSPVLASSRVSVSSTPTNGSRVGMFGSEPQLTVDQYISNGRYMAELITHMRHGAAVGVVGHEAVTPLQVKDRQWRFRSYPSSFVGSDAVSWLVKYWRYKRVFVGTLSTSPTSTPVSSAPPTPRAPLPTASTTSSSSLSPSPSMVLPSSTSSSSISSTASPFVASDSGSGLTAGGGTSSVTASPVPTPVLAAFTSPIVTAATAGAALSSLDFSPAPSTVPASSLATVASVSLLASPATSTSALQSSPVVAPISVVGPHQPTSHGHHQRSQSMMTSPMTPQRSTSSSRLLTSSSIATAHLSPSPSVVWPGNATTTPTTTTTTSSMISGSPMKYRVPGREDATSYLQRLQQLGLFKHVRDDRSFTDTYAFFRFTEDEKSHVLNSKRFMLPPSDDTVITPSTPSSAASTPANGGQQRARAGSITDDGSVTNEGFQRIAAAGGVDLGVNIDIDSIINGDMNDNDTWSPNPSSSASSTLGSEGHALTVSVTLLNMLLDSFKAVAMTSPNNSTAPLGHICVTNADRLRRHVLYHKFVREVTKLKNVGARWLSTAERVCFWINIFNTLHLHAAVEAAANANPMSAVAAAATAAASSNGNSNPLVSPRPVSIGTVGGASALPNPTAGAMTSSSSFALFGTRPAKTAGGPGGTGTGISPPPSSLSPPQPTNVSPFLPPGTSASLSHTIPASTSSTPSTINDTLVHTLNMYNDVMYDIDGSLYSLIDIERRIMRAGHSISKFLLPGTKHGAFGDHTFKRTSPKREFVFDDWDDRINFALTRATRSGPRVRVFTSADTLQSTLEECANDYVNEHLRITIGYDLASAALAAASSTPVPAPSASVPIPPAKSSSSSSLPTSIAVAPPLSPSSAGPERKSLSVVLPALLEWHSADFGGVLSSVLKWLLPYIPLSLKVEMMVHCSVKQAQFAIEPFDWTFHIDVSHLNTNSLPSASSNLHLLLRLSISYPLLCGVGICIPCGRRLINNPGGRTLVRSEPREPQTTVGQRAALYVPFTHANILYMPTVRSCHCICVMSS